jgi:hypothetical protein
VTGFVGLVTTVAIFRIRLLNGDRIDGERTPAFAQHPELETKKARCREEVAAGLMSNTAREEVRRTQRRHHIWEE